MKPLFAFLLLLTASSLSAQLNSTLRSQVDYDVPVNDVWGYVAPDGTEYAIVGLQTGVSFVSLADPDNATEVVRINGDNSIWRDMKTFGEYAYNVADQGNEGISVYDLRFLPDSVPFKRNLYPDVIGNGQTFNQAHNLYIDTLRGRIYTAGGSRRINDGGVLVFDLTQDPMSPVYIGKAPEVYAHDVFALGDTLYCSEIYDGALTMYDISDLENPVELGNTLTPFLFTHNAWTTTDGQTVFTTDERGDAPVAAYDISDADNIEKLDEFRPLASLNTGTIPHNVHVIGDFLSISYYTDGLVVADASKPDNIIEVANYDTWLGDDGDFNGAWGAYPWLPSGLTLVSDRQSGLYVVDVDYKAAARLEGIITDSDLGTPINNVRVAIVADQENFADSDATGSYKTGLANGGTYQVTFSAENYQDLTLSLSLVNGECLRLDTTLQSNIARFDFRATVVDDATGELIVGATFDLASARQNATLATDADGSATSRLFQSEYTYYVSKWGYQTVAGFDVSSDELSDLTVRLSPGYMDDFVSDQGWTASADEDTRKGFWERAVPLPTFYSGRLFAPVADSDKDFGEQAYVTDLPNDSASSNDVDGGAVTLTSPKFGPLNLRNLQVSYEYWFGNDGGNSAPDDALTISITNGTDTALVKTYERDGFPEWTLDSFTVADFVTPTDELQLIVETSDPDPNSNLVEAAFDNFRVTGDARPVSTEQYGTDALEVTVFPNPTARAFQLTYAGQVPVDRLVVTDALGRTVLRQVVNGNQLRFGQELPAGSYFAELYRGKQRLYSTKLVKE